jgi:hypothetical protein
VDEPEQETLRRREALFEATFQGDRTTPFIVSIIPSSEK